MEHSSPSDLYFEAPQAALAPLAQCVAALAMSLLAVGPAGLSIGIRVAGLYGGEEPAALIVREIRLPRTLLALGIGATLGLAGAALQGLLRNPLAAPELFGAPQAAAATASAVIAFGLLPATSFAVPLAGIAGALLSIGGLVAIAGRRASLTVTLLAGLALASFAGAATALVLNLAPNPFAALEVAFWLLGSLEDRSIDHLLIAAPFFLASWILLGADARAVPRADARRGRRRSRSASISAAPGAWWWSASRSASARRLRSRARSASSAWSRRIWCAARWDRIPRASCCRRRWPARRC